jgi:hypothetical protein
LHKNNIFYDKMAKQITKSCKRNKFVSTDTLNRDEKEKLQHLEISLITDRKCKGNSNWSQRSTAWEYFGELVYFEDTNKITIDNKNHYCKLCLEDEKKLYKTGKGGHISNVKSYSTGTATSSLLAHLQRQHNIAATAESDTPSKTTQSKLQAYFKSAGNMKPASNAYELNRDLTLFFALDLRPFTSVENDGFKYFFKKNFNVFNLPDSSTLRKCLPDVYEMVKEKVRAELANAQYLTVIVDGWSDRRGRPFVGTRVGFLTECFEYKVFTLSCKVVDKHTSANLSKHINSELADFDCDNLEFTLTTDGAANMLGISKGLKVSQYHCAAHILNLILMSDGVNNVPDIMNLITKCKDIVKSLHWRGAELYQERQKLFDREVMDNILQKIEKVNDECELDEDNPIKESVQDQHHHQTVKNSVPTRWNSVLIMISSILDLEVPVDEILKSSGYGDLRLTTEDLDLLKELQQFLSPFQEYTELVSGTKTSSHATLAFIPLLKWNMEMRMERIMTGDSSLCIKELAGLIKNSSNKRFRIEDAHIMATLLDLSLKKIWAKLPICNEENTDMFPKLKEHFVTYCKRTIARASQSDAKGIVASTTGTVSLKRKFIEEIPGDNEESDEIIKEVNRYFAYDIVDEEDENPLMFWKKNKDNFKVISKVALKYLTPSASSVAVESMFSITGLIVNAKRSRLENFSVNMLSFIHDNYKLVCPFE